MSILAGGTATLSFVATPVATGLALGFLSIRQDVIVVEGLTQFRANGI